MDVTANNQWVNSYLEALLSNGLSFEYLQNNNNNNGHSAQDSLAEEDRETVAAYYVHQILSLDEENIRNAYRKASTSARTTVGPVPAERDARIEYLSWRVWGMKRRRAEVSAAVAAHRREEADDAEDMEEIDATTLMTIDELNSTAMADFEDLKPFDSGTQDGVSSVGDDAAALGLDGTELAEPAPSHIPGPTGGTKASDVSPLVMPPPTLRLPSLSSGIKGASGSQGGSKVNLGVASPGLVSPFASVPPSPAVHSRRTTNTGGLDAFRAAWQQGALPPPSPPGATPGGTFTATGTGPDPLLVNRFPRLYVLLISLHGLVRGEKMELGKDPDTGGQVKYVVELAKALGQFPSVARVDLLTRLIDDPKVDKSYAEPEERLHLPPLPADVQAGLDAHASEHGTQAHSSNPAHGAFIVRLPCGQRNVYLRKEDLWPHVREFADRAIAHASATLARLQESGPCELYIVHGHYADAGEVAGLISSTLGVDCVLTGHSLGRNKKEHLLKSGTNSPAEVESQYRISRRIEAEERALDHAAVVFTSTQQEVAQQWGTYDGYSDELSAALQLRPCKGYHVPRMAVIPPGLDFSNLKVQMPVDPWEEILGVGKVSTPQPATPTGLDPLSQVPSVGGPATPSLHEGSIVASASAVDSTGDMSSNATPPTAEDGQSSGSGGHTGRHLSTGATRSGVASARGGPASPAPTPTRMSYHGASTPTALASSSALSHMNPSRMAALLVGESEPGIWKEINKFLRYPGRPVILAMARPDAKKNLIGLLKAYGDSRLLRDLANLVLVMGNRDKIDSMAPGSTRVLTDVLKLVDTYDLYGYVAYPKKHTQADISDIYLLAAATRGVFVNVALQEPFGLTLIEAAAHGVPIVATTHGGPVDIIATLNNGILVEPTDTRAIADALVNLITVQKRWDEASESGRRNITAYSWPSHCARYLRTVEDQKKTLANSRVATVFAGNHTKVQEPPGQHHHKGPPPGARIRHTLSLSYDDLSDLARAIAVNTTSTSAAIIKDAVAVVAAAAAAGDTATADMPAGEDMGADQAALARTSAPTVFQDLRTFSMPLSQAFISGLQRRQPRASGKQGGLNIPAPADVALAIANVTFDGPIPEVAEVESPKESASPKTPESRQPATKKPIAAATAAKPTDPQPEVDLSPSPVVSDNKEGPADPADAAATAADPAVTENNRETVNAVVASVAEDAVLDPSKWGKEEAVQSVLTAALNALNDGDQEKGASSGGVGQGALVKRRRSGQVPKEVGSGAFPTAGDQPLVPTLSFKAAQMTKTKEVQPRLHTHEHFVVFNFDSVTDVKTCAPLIRALLHGTEGVDESVLRTAQLLAGGANRSGSAQLGVGVMCAWGTKDMRSLLHAEGLDPNALDFMVCNAGALIWHSTAPQSNPEAVNSADTTRLLCDDEWEHYIDWRWDDRVVKQVLGRVLDNKAGWGRLNILRSDSSLPTGTTKKNRATVTRATSGAGVSSSAFSVTVGLSPASSPLHFMLDVEIQPPPSTSAAQKDAMSTSEVAKQLLATIRRKLRRSGLRAQLLITPREPIPSTDSSLNESGSSRGGLAGIFNTIAATLTRSASGNLATLNKSNESLRGFVLHITPLRCSRALALRHLALCSRRDLAGHWTLVNCPATAAPLPAGKTAPLSTTSVSGSLVTLSTSPSLANRVPPVLLSGSDGEDMVAGVQRVVVLAPNKQVPAIADTGKASGELSTLPMASVAYPVDVGVYQAKALSLMAAANEAAEGGEASARILVLS